MERLKEQTPAPERPASKPDESHAQLQPLLHGLPRHERMPMLPLRFRTARLWRNPGIRRLAAIGLLALLASLLLVWALTQYEAHRLKREWIARGDALIGTLAAAHPEWAPELPKLFAEGSSDTGPDAAAAGRQLAEQYGLSAEMENSLLPIVSSFRSHARLLSTGAAAALLLLLFAVLIYEYNKPYRAIRALAASLEEAVKRNEPLQNRIYGEGDLGLLAHGVQELALRLQETIAQLHRDKKFLKDTIADISHQLKTPLASLTIYIELLQDPRTKPEDAQEFLETCRRELERMEWLTLTLLKIARLEAEALELMPRDLPIAETIEQAVLPMRKLAEQRDVRLEIAAPADLLCYHDPHWLAEAIGNVVKNAVEHSPAGSAVRVEAEETPVFVRLSISDEGLGIEERHLPHIFKKFYSASRGGSGVGLGLPLAKSIVERHEGVLSASRNDRGGTTFRFTLPHRRLTNP
ncbi:HAMP domain-containing sensor histidine kinase [Cohnella lubricantis]|uniref:histidine kinase n=1 Tax=Cohnella lubricantis TaxID=2163172 RepID=A0A841T9T6_9BACL|nr:HAMP domain-containing sensor histidine kinase [Cohnella lubricantis]MBB6676809.1 HAMP domain-containing histidine kinase [Cohnella lubricantis]MBP2118103.1 signal transduction histidine kinase [Cohnella lubricantis]